MLPGPRSRSVGLQLDHCQLASMPFNQRTAEFLAIEVSQCCGASTTTIQSHQQSQLWSVQRTPPFSRSSRTESDFTAISSISDSAAPHPVDPFDLDPHLDARHAEPSSHRSADDPESAATINHNPEPSVRISAQYASRQTSQQKATLNLPCYFLRPYQITEQDRVFSGRRSLLKYLKDALIPETDHPAPPMLRSIAVHGIGGIGKTQTVLAFVIENLEHFDAVLWVRADGRAKAEQSFADFAVQLGLAKEPVRDRAKVIADVIKWLEGHDRPWLLVFDNADTQESLGLLGKGVMFPSSGKAGAVIVLSQKNLMQELKIRDVEVDRLELYEAVELLRVHMTRAGASFDQADAEQVASRVGRIPIGLQAAAQFICGQGLTLRDYLLAWDDEQPLVEASEPGDRGAGDPYEHSLRTVWNLALNELAQHKDATDLLHVLAFLDPDAIVEETLRQGLDGDSDPETIVTTGLTAKKFLIRARAKLRQRALIGRNEELGQLWTHRLVSTGVRLKLDPKQWCKAFWTAFGIISTSWPRTEDHARHIRSNWPKQEELFPHVKSLSVHLREKCKSSNVADKLRSQVDRVPQVIKLFLHASWYCYERGLFDACNSLLDDTECCLSLLQAVDHLIIHDVHFHLGATATETNALQLAYNEFVKSAASIQQAIQEGRREEIGEKEALSIASLGNGSAGLGRYSEAIEYYQKAFGMFKKPRDNYPPHLSTCLRLRGEPEAAKQVVEALIAKRKAQYGPEDTTSFL